MGRETMTPFQQSKFGFVKSATGQERNFYPAYYDFMAIAAILPYPAIGFGYDGTSSFSDPTDGTPYYHWLTPGVEPGWGVEFYNTVTTTVNYFSGFSSVTVRTMLPYWENPNDPTSGTPVTTPATDLRITGIPGASNFVTTEVTTYINSSHVGGPDFAGATMPGPYGDYQQNVDGSWYQAVPPAVENSILEQDEDFPPTVTVAGVTEYWNLTGAPGTTHNGVNYGFDGKLPDPYHAYYNGVVSSTIAYSGGMTGEQFIANVQALCGAVALSPGQYIGTREGNVFFDYFGVDATTKYATNYVTNQRYDQTGTAVITVPANQMLGITCGANEAGMTDDVLFAGQTSDTDNFAFDYWPAVWTGQSKFGNDAPGGTISTSIRVPYWAGGENQNRGAEGPFPDTTVFVTKNGSITLYGGTLWTSLTQWQATTVQAVGDAITNGGGQFSGNPYLRIVCVAIRLDATTGDTEPTWTPTVGWTVWDGNVQWQVTDLGTPVTARITIAHVNKLLLFPLKEGAIITNQYEGKIIPVAANMYFNPDFGGDGGTIIPGPGQDFWCASSRITVPKTYATYLQDVTCFGDMSGTIGNELLQVPNLLYFTGDTLFDGETAPLTEALPGLTPGLHIFGPTEAASMGSGQGFISF